MSSFMWPQDSTTHSTPSTVQSFSARLPIGVHLPSTAGGAPRLSKARRREGRIFTHSASSSMSSFDSASTCSIISAEFWMPPQLIIPKAAYITVAPLDVEMKTMPPTMHTPKPKTKTKPANIIIPHDAPAAIATVVSPTSPSKTPLPSTPVSFPSHIPEAVPTLPCTPRTPLSPFSPLSPNRLIPSPNARIRKLAKLTRTLGENIPVELVFPSTAAAPTATVTSSTKFAKLAKTFVDGAVSPRAAPAGPRLSALRRRASAATEWPLTPTPDCTVDKAANSKTAVGLHYALGMNSIPTRASTLIRAAPTLPSSPPPFSSVFTMDDVSWERARQAVMGTKASKKSKMRLAVGGVRKAAVEANGRGAWRKKENTWSGEWNVEDIEELQVQLRRLKRH
ncbi:hypothetical protein C8R43DRAFT_947944 [Mycena crocata]|nr:hypothetical protein C8R43DRAFT_947944 [Mycena crocata]